MENDFVKEPFQENFFWHTKHTLLVFHRLVGLKWWKHFSPFTLTKVQNDFFKEPFQENFFLAYETYPFSLNLIYWLISCILVMWRLEISFTRHCMIQMSGISPRNQRQLECLIVALSSIGLKVIDANFTLLLLRLFDDLSRDLSNCNATLVLRNTLQS